MQLAVLPWRYDAEGIPTLARCCHGFEYHLQPFVLTLLGLIQAYGSVFCFHLSLINLFERSRLIFKIEVSW